MAAYAASKAGLIGLTQVLAAELGAQGIRVTAILPGGTDTPMGRTVANTPEIQASVEGLHALKRIAAPEEIARSVLHPASEASSFMTGAALLVDGGVSINRTCAGSPRNGDGVRFPRLQARHIRESSLQATSASPTLGFAKPPTRGRAGHPWLRPVMAGAMGGDTA